MRVKRTFYQYIFISSAHLILWVNIVTLNVNENSACDYITHYKIICTPIEFRINWRPTEFGIPPVCVDECQTNAYTYVYIFYHIITNQKFSGFIGFDILHARIIARPAAVRKRQCSYLACGCAHVIYCNKRFMRRVSSPIHKYYNNDILWTLKNE